MLSDSVGIQVHGECGMDRDDHHAGPVGAPCRGDGSGATDDGV